MQVLNPALISVIYLITAANCIILDKVIDKTFDQLEHFWRLGWPGYSNFPHDPRWQHLQPGLHLNHHRLPSSKQHFYGLPADGIMERGYHPLHHIVSSLYHYHSPYERHVTAINDVRQFGQFDTHNFVDHIPFESMFDYDYIT